MKRTKSVIINFITDALPQVIIGLIGFFKIKIFVNLLGTEQLGLYQLYSNILAYLVLLEGGVGSALLFRLYKPIKEKDDKSISAIMAASKIIFNTIGIAIIVLGIVISFFIGFFVKEVVISDLYMQMAFLLFLVSQAMYYFVVPYRTMFEADQKRYIPNIVYQATIIIKSIVEIVIVLSGMKLIAILISLIICGFISNTILCIIFKKIYKNIDFKVKKDYTMLKDVKDLFVNTLGNLLTNNIDIILISKFLGLGFVAIYSTYNYIIEAIKQFIDKITGATMAGIGDLVLCEKEKINKVFDEFNNFVFFLGTILAVPLFIIMNKFINIWYEGKIETNIVIAIMFTIILFYQTIRIPLKVFTLSTGKFKEVKKFVILEIIINLGLSLLLVKTMGISGVLLATIISLIIADFCTKPIVLYKELLERKPYKYYIKSIINTAWMALLATILYFIIPQNYDNIFMCIVYGCVVGIINLIITSGYYYITKQFDFLDRFCINKIIKKGKKV